MNIQNIIYYNDKNKKVKEKIIAEKSGDVFYFYWLLGKELFMPLTFFENYIANISIVQELEFLLRIVIAGICGAMIGFERTRRFKEAGIRTHILVAAASALMMIIV